MKKSYRTGIDGTNFQLNLVGTDANTYMEEQELRNSCGELFATVEIKNGILYLYVNLPKLLRQYNTWPLSPEDFVKLNDIKDYYIDKLQNVLDEQWIFCDIRKSLLKRIECGTTQPVAEKCTCSAVISFWNICFYKNTNFLHESAEKEYRYCKKVESLYLGFKDRGVNYKIKIYDKSFEQRNSGNNEVKNNLLRIEIVFLRAAINKLFGGEVTLCDLFSQNNLTKIIDEYKRLLVEVLVKKYVNPCIEDTTSKVFETLTQVKSTAEAVAICKQFITDKEVLREALRRFYKFKGATDERARRNADKAICDSKKYALPQSVIKTIREFEDSCK